MQEDYNPPEVIIDNEFQVLLPPLAESVFQQLEQKEETHCWQTLYLLLEKFHLR